MDTPHERLKEARKKAGFSSASEAANALGVSPGTYLGHENGNRAFDIEAAKKYSRRFKVTLTWLLTGEGEMTFAPPRVRLEKHRGPRVRLESGPEELQRIPYEEWDPEAPEHSEEEHDPAYADGYYQPRMEGARPEIDVRAGAGYGNVGEQGVVTISAHGTVTGHRVTGEWVIPEHFYRHELNASPAGSLIMPILGDSMFPTLASGDRVIVDTYQDKFSADGIYVFDDGDGEPRVKRLSKVLFSEPEQVQIISDNPLHATQTVDLSRVRVIGRVSGKISRL